MKHLDSFVQHMMLVDDDQDACILFEKALRKVNPTVEFSVAHSAEELLENLGTHLPHILFLDLTLPGKSGMQCLQELKADPSREHIKVVVYSNSARISDISQAYERGADLFIVKPFSQSHLVNALEHVLEMEWNKNGLPDKYFINNQFVAFTRQFSA
jgi:CheY-like chemotaxis protein